jgi:tetratricopeptide (TPR) repeat protein
MTISRNQVWNDSLTLWQDNARKSPNKGIVLSNLAAECLNRNMPEKSLQFFVRAIEVSPNLDFRAKIGIGSSLKALKIYGSRFTTGEEYIIPGGPYNSGNVDYGNFSKWEAVINNTIGLAYEHLNEPTKARRMYEASVTMNPAYDLGWYNLAILSAKEGKKEQVFEAIGHLKSLNPAMADSLESIVRH